MEEKVIIDLDIDEDLLDESGVDFIALVDRPAIERNWMAFSQQKHRFKIDDKQKRIVSGYAMVAELPIVRIRPDGEEYYTRFKAEAIKKIVFKFFKNGFVNNVNEMHDSNKIADGVFVFESLLVDSERGVKAPDGFEEAPDGSWWVSMRIENEEIWQSVLDGTFQGFSVEGMFVEAEETEEDEKIIEKIQKEIQNFFNKNSLSNNKQPIYKKTNTMSTEENKTAFEKFKDSMKDILFPESSKEKFLEATLKEGGTVVVEPELAVGATVVVRTEEGDIPAPDGDYELSDGMVIVTAGGVITEVKPVEELQEVIPQDLPKEVEEKIRKVIESVETHYAEAKAEFNKAVEEAKVEKESLKTELKELKEAFASHKESVEEKNKEIFKAVQELAEEPEKNPATPKKDKFSLKKQKENIFIKNKKQ